MEEIWTESQHLELYRMPGFHNIQTIRKSAKIMSLPSFCDSIEVTSSMALLRGYVSGVGREKTIVPNYGNKKNDKTNIHFSLRVKQLGLD